MRKFRNTFLVKGVPFDDTDLEIGKLGAPSDRNKDHAMSEKFAILEWLRSVKDMKIFDRASLFANKGESD